MWVIILQEQKEELGKRCLAFTWPLRHATELQRKRPFTAHELNWTDVTDLNNQLHDTFIGNESGPKITINYTIFFLKLQSAFS